MKLVEIKSVNEVTLPGVRVEFVTEGTLLKEVIFRPEGSEDSWSIRPGPAYQESLKVFRRSMFETVERFRLSGTVLGVRVQEDFDTRNEAESKEALTRGMTLDWRKLTAAIRAAVI